MNRIEFALALGLLVSGTGVAAGADPDLVFEAPYDGSAASTAGKGSPVQPTLARGLTYVPGVRGRAVQLRTSGKGSPAAALTYPAGKLFAAPSGTIEFWLQPSWDGYLWNDQMTTYPLFGADAASGARINVFMWHWLRCDLVSARDGKTLSLEQRCRNTWMKGDWWHLCLTWDAGRGSVLYVNGVPSSSQVTPQLADVKNFSVGGTVQGAGDVAIDEFRIYSRVLSGQEILRHFREVVPVDFALERRCLRADREEKVLIEILPAAGAARPAKGKLNLRLVADADEHTVAARGLDFDSHQRAAFTLDVGKLAPGQYRLAASLTCSDTRFERSFPIAAYTAQPASLPSNEPLARGECLLDVDCTKLGRELLEKGGTRTELRGPGGVAYLEAGSGKWDRFAFPMQLPNTDGSPVLVETTWPDDHPRAMGLYLYPRDAKGFGQFRERLYAGILAGDEYPSSGRMHSTSYLAFPVISDNLFEARTLISGMPAALARVRVYRLAGRLPRLEIHSPRNRPGRALGHLDEDQSFEYQIAPFQDGKSQWQRHPLDYPVRVVDNLLDYMDYAGLTVMSYSLARYHWTHLDEGPINNLGDGFRVAGFPALLLDRMADRGKQLIANINLYTMSGATAELVLDATSPEAAGRHSIWRNGQRDAGSAGQGGANPVSLGDNPVHPQVRARMLQIVSEILRRFGNHTALKGIDLWCSENSPFLFGSLEKGYDDYTVSLFERETGTRVPVKQAGAGRFAERFHYLTGPGRMAWLNWRAKKTTELFREIDALVRKTRPDLECYLSIADWHGESPAFLARHDAEQFDFTTYSYEQLSLDLPSLAKMPSLVLTPQKTMNYDRWMKHWYGSEQMNVISEMNWNPKLYSAFSSGPDRSVSLFVRYFESFMPSLKQDSYPAQFQDCDAKPWGRFFLQDFAVALASQDASQILVGAQSLGTAGREPESREFALAFGALPRERFADVAGTQDPVTIRSLALSEGTYFYAVNLLSAPVSVAIGLQSKAAPTVTDLSTATPVAVQDHTCVVELKPFQLRSFFCPHQPVTLASGKVEIPAAVRAWYASRVSHCRSIAGRSPGDMDGGTAKRVVRMEHCLAEGRLAEVHRLLFSKRVRTLLATDNREAAGPPVNSPSTASLANGSMELEDRRDSRLSPQGWSFFASGSAFAGRYARDDRSQVHSGAGALAITAGRESSKEGYGMWLMQDWIAVSPGAAYSIEGWIRTANCTGGGAWLWILPYETKDGQAVGQISCPKPMSHLAGTEDWREWSEQVLIGKNVHWLRIACRLDGAGTAWFDDIRVSKEE